jgi:ribosomal-protein-alanine N-acetyltransferase
MTAGPEIPSLLATPFRLRKFCHADLNLVREAASDPLIPLITTVPAMFTEEEGLKFIERQLDRLLQGIGYSFVIAEESTDLAVGSIGLWLQNIDQGRASIGYWVVASQRGRNAAGYALKEIVRWALEELKIPRLELYVEPWNVASIRTAERAGFKQEGLLRSWQQVGNERRDMFIYSVVIGDH